MDKERVCTDNGVEDGGSKVGECDSRRFMNFQDSSL